MLAMTAAPQRQYFALPDFRFECGTVLPGATLAYATFGTLNAARDNAVLVPSWYGADHHGYDVLIGPGLALDPAHYFVVATEMFANGFSSSPSTTPAPHAGPDFPAIEIRDNVEATRRLLVDGLGITHLRAVIGFSMGAQQAYQWAVSHPDFVSAIVPYCGAAKSYPHGIVRLEGAIAALTADGTFAGGRYTAPPAVGLAAWSTHWVGWIWSQEWWKRELHKPTWANRDEVIAARIARDAWRDPNNLIAQARAWQRHDVGRTPGFDGDLTRALRSIRAQVLCMPSATDLYFPAADAEEECAHIPHATFRPIPSLWGHSAGSGANPADVAFLNEQIAAFLRT